MDNNTKNGIKVFIVSIIIAYLTNNVWATLLALFGMMSNFEETNDKN